MDYQGNSKKEKQVVEIKPKNIEKIVKGDVVVKERTLGSRFKNVFLGGDLDTTAKYVASEVILPLLRNLLADTISKGADRLIYGDSGPRVRRPTNYAGRTQYNNPITTRAYLPDQRPVNRWAPTGRKPIDDIVVGDKADADRIVERVTDVVDQYDVVSLADLYDLVGLPSTHVDNKWGWTQIPAIEVRQVREGWKLSFPPLEEIQ